MTRTAALNRHTTTTAATISNKITITYYGTACNNPFSLDAFSDYRTGIARLPRIVLPGIPHHVTQRSNRREQTFFEDGDYALYLDLLADAAGRAGAEVWSYCLMPNHAHIVATPDDEDGLSRTFRYVHRHYTGYINARMRVTVLR